MVRLRNLHSENDKGSRPTSHPDIYGSNGGREESLLWGISGVLVAALPCIAVLVGCSLSQILI